MKSNKGMIDWKILVVIFIVFILLAGSLNTEIGVDLLESLSDGITGFVGFETSPVVRNINFTSTIVLSNLEVDVKDETNLSLTSEPFHIYLKTRPKQTIKINDKTDLRNFRGVVVIVNSTANMNGRVLSISNVDYETPIDIESSEFVFQSIVFENLRLDDLKLETQGFLTTDDLEMKIDGDFEIFGFLGKTSFTPEQLYLEGRANKIIISGEQKLSLVS